MGKTELFYLWGSCKMSLFPPKKVEYPFNRAFSNEDVGCKGSSSSSVLKLKMLMFN